MAHGVDCCICVQITAFKQFFVSLTLPYSVKRGEEFALQVTVFNYLSTQLWVNRVYQSVADNSTFLFDHSQPDF